MPEKVLTAVEMRLDSKESPLEPLNALLIDAFLPASCPTVVVPELVPSTEAEDVFPWVLDLSRPRSRLAATFLVDAPQLSSWLQSKPSLCSASLESSMNLASM